MKKKIVKIKEPTPEEIEQEKFEAKIKDYLKENLNIYICIEGREITVGLNLGEENVASYRDWLPDPKITY